VKAAQLNNTGMLQGNDTLALTTRALSNGATGQLVSGSPLNYPSTRSITPACCW
jgi:filamentous hemagglutinin